VAAQSHKHWAKSLPTVSHSTSTEARSPSDLQCPVDESRASRSRLVAAHSHKQTVPTENIGIAWSQSAPPPNSQLESPPQMMERQQQATTTGRRPRDI